MTACCSMARVNSIAERSRRSAVRVVRYRPATALRNGPSKRQNRVPVRTRSAPSPPPGRCRSANATTTRPSATSGPVSGKHSPESRLSRATRIGEIADASAGTDRGASKPHARDPSSGQRAPETSVQETRDACPGCCRDRQPAAQSLVTPATGPASVDCNFRRACSGQSDR